MEEEIWKHFKDNIEVSSLGNIRNKNTKKILKKRINDANYETINITYKCKGKTYKVHRMICYTFSPIQGYNNLDDYKDLYVNHKNGIRSDNNIKNLEWVTPKENSQHAVETGLNNSRKKVNQYEILDKTLIENNSDIIISDLSPLQFKLIKQWNSLSEVANFLNIHSGRITIYCQKKKTCNGFFWEYAEKSTKAKKEKYIGSLDNFIPLVDYRTSKVSNYMISRDGEIYSKKRKIIVSQMVKNGYQVINLSFDNTHRENRVHILIAQHFIPNPNKLPLVNHKDGNKINNNISNLEWVTHQQNAQHAWDTGLATSYRDTPVIKYDLQGNKLQEYSSMTEAFHSISDNSHINVTNIGLVCKRKRHSYMGYIFRYADDTDIVESYTRGGMYKSVVKYDLNGNKLQEYSTIYEASKAHDPPINTGSITNVCKRTTKTCMGFVFRYSDDTFY